MHVAGCIILLKEATDVRANHCHEGVYLVLDLPSSYSVSWCCLFQLCGTHKQNGVKADVTHQTTFFFFHYSMVQFWCSDAGMFGGRQGSTWAFWLICSYTATHTASCDSLCILDIDIHRYVLLTECSFMNNQLKWSIRLQKDKWIYSGFFLLQVMLE